MSSYGTDGKLNKATLKNNLENVAGIDKTTIPEETREFPWTVEVDEYEVTIDENGNVTIAREGNGETGKPSTPTYNTATTVQEAIAQDLPYESKTQIQDSYGNTVVVPEGFKIALDSATDVTGGIVIEDVENEVTAGSQFVWIPVGEVKTANGIKTIELSRYTFATDGTPTKHGENAISNYNYYVQELATSSLGNTAAKNIEDFKTGATNNHGYYIGRYEARIGTERTSESQELEQVTVKPNDYVYSLVTQPQAATLAQGMYTSSNFTSDLINSYAWDTAIVFIQNFGQANYSMQTSLNKTCSAQGTNNLTDLAQQDKQLNIWDMASNDWEWTTETSSHATYPCVGRGGGCTNYYTSYRNYYSTSNAYSSYSFRVVLHL